MIKWEDKYSVGMSVIDEEHKKFIDIINKATYVKQYDDSPRAISEILVELTAYALEHFKTEEFCMKYYKYYDYKSHKEEHNKFSKTISDYSKKLIDGEVVIIDEVLEHLKQYFVNHIQEIDKRYTACFNENNLSK